MPRTDQFHCNVCPQPLANLLPAVVTHFKRHNQRLFAMTSHNEIFENIFTSAIFSFERGANVVGSAMWNDSVTVFCCNQSCWKPLLISSREICCRLCRPHLGNLTKSTLCTQL